MKLINILALSICLFHPLSYGDELYVSQDVGRGQFEMKSSYSVDSKSVSVEYTSLGFSGGYMSDYNVFVEGQISLGTNDNIFNMSDSYKLREKRLAVGYSLEVFDYLRLVPRVGLSRWKLDTKEGKFMNPGKELEDQFRGTNFYSQINVEFPVSDLIQIYASYMKSNYDFGKTQSTKIGIKFAFAL